MTRTVLVTGGDSGIGAATCQLFRDADHRVVANYHSDDARARAFSVKTGVMVQKWDVADFAA